MGGEIERMKSAFPQAQPKLLNVWDQKVYGFSVYARNSLTIGFRVVSTIMGPFNNSLAKYNVSKIDYNITGSLHCIQSSFLYIFSFNDLPFLLIVVR